MNTLWVVVVAAVVIYVAYNFYARRIDRDIIQSNDKRATPAKMYMDGVDYMPASRNVLYGYHFKSIAAAGPIVGVITAANLWGWLPSILWLMIGVSFIGWVSDYTAIMVSVRNDGNSMSAIAHKLIAPRTRTILFVFIFCYLLLVAGAFVGILAAILSARPDVPFGILVLAIMGLLASQMLYKVGGQAALHGHRPDGGRPAHPGARRRRQTRLDRALQRLDRRHQYAAGLYILGSVFVCLLLPGRQSADLAFCPPGQLHRLLGDAHHDWAERRGSHRGPLHGRARRHWRPDC